MTLLPGGRDQQISEEMIEAAAKALHDLNDPIAPWEEAPSVWRFQYKRAYAEPILIAALALLPAEAAIRAKIADEIDAHRVHYDECDHCEALRSAANIARGSATEETR